ncbi:sigma-70 family RNA polymerase sigma factor [Parabacteroides sp. OttesenSCG-928-G06]|nr:sigma-70 family RNA polymerase sigma factor [Parabacteroides sp. OttesenSCG-928-G06]
MEKEESKKHTDIINAVWEQFRRGERDALAGLFQLTSDRLFRYGSKFYSDEEIVKDCIQELFIKIHQNREKMPALENPLFYLFKALKNILFDTIQQREKIVCFSPQEIPFRVEFEFAASEEEVDDEAKEQFEKVMSLLSDRQKEAIYLRYQMEINSWKKQLPGLK